jgi:hypothetical protein
MSYPHGIRRIRRSNQAQTDAWLVCGYWSAHRIEEDNMQQTIRVVLSILAGIIAMLSIPLVLNQMPVALAPIYLLLLANVIFTNLILFRLTSTSR